MKRISPDALFERMAAHSLGNAIIVDVRMPFEFRGGSVPGAVNIPMKEVLARKEELQAYDTVYLLCQSGGRSEMTGMILYTDGLTQVCNVEGGTMAWREKNFPIDMPKE